MASATRCSIRWRASAGIAWPVRLAREGHGTQGRKDASALFPALVATSTTLGQALSTPAPAFASLHVFLKGDSEAVREAVRYFSL